MYSNGASEEVIGKAIKKYNIPRHKVVILSKCSGVVREGNSEEVLALTDVKDRPDYVNQYGKFFELSKCFCVDVFLLIVLRRSV